MSNSSDMSGITKWRSIVTLIVFVVTNIVVLFPFKIPIPIPSFLWAAWTKSLSALRVATTKRCSDADQTKKLRWLSFPINFLTAPLIGVLFLLCLTAIGRKEVHDGTVGADHIYPIEIMAFFITLAYIAISIDASGLIRWLALKVLQKGGSNGHLLFLYLYCFFFALASFIGNDPIVLSGTPFLAYMTRLSSNIRDPKAWIYTQFSVANIASAILVSSNPTNLVLAGAFDIKFIEYTANMIVPVIITAIIFFPFLLYYVFRDESLVPRKIIMHELPPGEGGMPINPHIPYAGGITEADKDPNTERGELLSLEEIMSPYLDKKSATVGSVIMAVTLVTILVLNAASTKEYPAYWITLPAAVVMLCWDLVYGWKHRHETRRIGREGRAEAARRQHEERAEKLSNGVEDLTPSPTTNQSPAHAIGINSNEKELASIEATKGRRTLASLIVSGYGRAQETFPTVTAVLSHLPFPLVQFGLCMFVLVQALVTKGWITVFAYGWYHWINATGTVGAIGGMGFISVILCNVSPPNPPSYSFFG